VSTFNVVILFTRAAHWNGLLDSEIGAMCKTHEQAVERAEEFALKGYWTVGEGGVPATMGVLVDQFIPPHKIHRVEILPNGGSDQARKKKPAKRRRGRR
jgi:hypothetical protein